MPNGQVRNQDVEASEDSPIGRTFMLNPNLFMVRHWYRDGEERTWRCPERMEWEDEDELSLGNGSKLETIIGHDAEDSEN